MSEQTIESVETGAPAGTVKPSLSERLEPVVIKLAQDIGAGIKQYKGRIIAISAIALAIHTLYQHPPLESVEPGQVGIRINQLSGNTAQFREGSVLVIPGLHQLRRLSLRTQIYRPQHGHSASGSAPFQSIEGLSLGLDVSLRYALDPAKIDTLAKTLPDDINGQVVEPIVQGVIYKTLARYTVKEIFSSKRAEIQAAMEAEIKPRLAADGIIFNALLIGNIDLPRDYKAGMESLMAEELQSEKMRYTLELREKQVKENELSAEAEKVKREKAAEAAGQEQIIAAKAQAEAMKHVLPFKQKQIEQRSLEAEAEKISRLKAAEASAEARRIEAAGEADSRRKLADAEIYRQERVGQVASEQLARDGATLQKNPLLIQKAMADKLSDKVSVIIAPTPRDGGFIGSSLLGLGKQKATQELAGQAQPAANQSTEEEGQE